MIATNNLTSVDQLAYAAHINAFWRLARCTDWEVVFFNPRRMSIDNMRNRAAQSAIDLDCQTLVFLDDDVLLERDHFIQLVEEQQDSWDVLAGVTLIRGYPYPPMLFDFAQGRESHYVAEYATRPLRAGTKGSNVDAVGFSLCAIRVDLFREIRALEEMKNIPFFHTGPNYTEDVYFCQVVRNNLKDKQIGFMPTILTGHLLGTSLICPANVEAQKQYDESVYPGIKG